MAFGTNIHLIDLLIICGYLALCLVIGISKIGKIKTLRDYTLGSKPFSTTFMVTTLFATAVSAEYAVGIVEKTYSLGLVYMLPLVFYPFGWVLMSRLLSRNFNLLHKQKFLTLGDVMEHWYGKYSKWVTSFCAIAVVFATSAISIKVIGYLFQHFLGISELYGALVAVAVITAYSAFGGVQAVVVTDFFQFLIFFIVLPLACAIGVNKAGGIQNIFSLLPTSHLTIDSSNIWLFLSLIFYSVQPHTGLPYMQRVLMAKDKSQVEKAFSWAGGLMIPFLCGVCLMGLSVYTINQNLNPSNALYYFIGNHLSTGMIGFMVAGLLAIIMSTQDSFLNATSTLIARDIGAQIWPSLTDKNQLTIARVSCVVIIALSTILAFSKNSIMDILWSIDNFWDPLVTIPLLAALFGARISNKSFGVLVLICCATILVARLVIGEFGIHSLVVGTTTSIIVIWIAHIKHRKNTPEEPLLQREKLPPLVRLQSIAASNTLNFNSLLAFSIMVLVGYTLSLFVSGVSQDLVMIFRITSAVLCLALLLKDFWSEAVGPKATVWFWNFSLGFCLPFMASYFMFGSGYQYLWIAYFILSSILLYMLTNPVIFVILTVIGSGVGYGLFMCGLAPQNFEYFNSAITALYSCVFVILTMLLFWHNKRFVGKQVVSELKEKMAEQEMELEAALTIKHGVMRNIGHEIRMPLQAMSLPTEMLFEDVDKFNKKHNELIRMLKEGYDRMTALFGNCFAFIDFGLNKKGLFIQEHDLKVIAEEMIQEMVWNMELPKISKPMAIPEIKINATGNMQVECDRERIRHVVACMFSNAIRYGKGTKIEVEIKRDEKYICFGISDRGQGIPAGELESIFEVFEESSRTKSPAGGRGVGLAACRKIIEAHKGKIWAENNKHGGASFYFLLHAR